MNVTSRARWALARRPWLYWVAIGVLAAGAGLLVADAVGAVDDARRRWGTERNVLVAERDAGPGEPVAGIVVTRSWPAPMIPAAALIDDVPDEAVLRQRVGAGEILTTADVAAGSAPQALIPVGHRAVSVMEAVPSGAGVGDDVAVASGGVVLAADAVVVGVRDDAVLVAVPIGDAAAVAAAAPGDVALLIDP
jgi:hypothetical protein